MKKFLFIFLLFTFHLFPAYSQTPTEEWVRRWPSSSPLAVGSAGISVKQDSLGFIYVLADTGGGFGFLKYDPAGNLVLYATHKPAGYEYSGGGYFDLTPSGEVYVTGSVGIELNYWIYTVKFNSSGVFQWGRFYNFDTNDEADDLKLDRAGNIIIVGRAIIGNNSLALTLKYNSAGDTLWTRRFIADGNSKVTIDNSNYIYSTGAIGFPGKCLILKYDPMGNLNWFKTFTLDSTRTNLGQGIALDLTGNIYVIGTVSMFPLGLNDFLLKLDNSSSILWNKVFTGIVSGQGNNDGYPIGPVVSPEGNSVFYLTRSANGMGGGAYAIVTLNYNSSGDTQWVRIFNGGGVFGAANFPSTIRLDRYDNIYICGSGYYPTTGSDFITVKYTTGGVQQWVARYTGILTNAEDRAEDLLIDTSLNIYVTGLSKKITNYQYDAVTIKYNQPNGISSNNNEIPEQFKLEQNYPNPFNSITIINYELPRTSYVKLILYNMLGEEVYTLASGRHIGGSYSIAFNMENFSSGIYFYRLLADEKLIETKKLILLR